MDLLDFSRIFTREAAFWRLFHGSFGGLEARRRAQSSSWIVRRPPSRAWCRSRWIWRSCGKALFPMSQRISGVWKLWRCGAAPAFSAAACERGLRSVSYALQELQDDGSSPRDRGRRSTPPWTLSQVTASLLQRRAACGRCALDPIMCWSPGWWWPSCPRP